MLAALRKKPTAMVAKKAPRMKSTPQARGSPSTWPNRWPAMVAPTQASHSTSPLPARCAASSRPAACSRRASAQLPSPMTSSDG